MGFQAVSFSTFLEMLNFLENMTGGALGRTKDLQPISVLERCLKKENLPSRALLVLPTNQMKDYLGQLSSRVLILPLNFKAK